jgi:hypothetical protein
MLNQIKKLFNQSLESLKDSPEEFNRALQIAQLQDNYARLSNNRFANNPDYQRELKAMGTSYGGMMKITQLLARIKA